METVTGGCQCGRVRFTAEIADNDAYLCHCRMCQRATGGVSIAFKNVPKTGRQWQGTPDWYQSSPIARRPFCAACGTPLGFEFLDGPNCDLTVGSFDAPARFVPVSQFGIESRHDAWCDTLALPGTRCDEHEALVKRWADAGMVVPM
jgi:hypothetical protein